MNFVKYIFLFEMLVGLIAASHAAPQASGATSHVNGCASTLAVDVVPAQEFHLAIPRSNSHDLQLLGVVVYVSYFDESSVPNIMRPSNGKEVPPEADVVVHWWTDFGDNVKATHLRCAYGLGGITLIEVDRVLIGGYRQCWVKRVSDTSGKSKKFAYCE